MSTEEILYDNPQLFFKMNEINRQAQNPGPWHHHKELEILAIQKGRLDIYIENEIIQLNSGDVFIIGPNQLHTDRSYTDLNYNVIQFNLRPYLDQSTLSYERFFSDPNLPLSRMNSIIRGNPNARISLKDIVNEIHEEWAAKTEGYEFAIGTLIRKVLLLLIRTSPKKILKDNFNTDFLRLKPVFDFIEQNLSEKITVDDASKYANVSYYYFVKIFKRVMGMSFVDYVNQQRIRKAEKILLTTDLSVAQVGEQVGIPNTVHFYRMFRKFNQCPPNDYRKTMRSWPLDNRI